MTGGTGNDTFTFVEFDGVGQRDVIKDFTLGEDIARLFVFNEEIGWWEMVDADNAAIHSGKVHGDNLVLDWEGGEIVFRGLADHFVGDLI